MDIVSILGDREKGTEFATFSGGKDVCRSGWTEVADVVESIEALRRLMEGPEAISDFRRLGG
jgi:hypothetical protein